MLRVVRPRDSKRPADVLVDPSAPTTKRAVPRQDACPPSSTELALEPLDEALETVHTGELLLEPYLDLGDATPVTGISPWQRSAPPPLPEES